MQTRPSQDARNARSVALYLMDFLLLPNAPTGTPPRVRYVADTSYDGGEFNTYPARVGWAQALPNAGRVPFLSVERRIPSSDADLEPFLQNWLFFGLLHHMLDPFGLFNADEYLLREDTETFITSKLLLSRLQTWLDRTWLLDQHKQDQEVRRVMFSLQCCSEVEQVLNLAEHAHFNRATRMLLASVAQLVEEAVISVDTSRFDMLRRITPVKLDDDDEQHMIASGWCPSEIPSVQNQFCCTATRIFLRCMSKPRLGQSHLQCDQDTCHGLQILLDEYQASHFGGCGRCEMAGPDAAMVHECLASGSFPVLDVTFKSDGSVSLEAIPYTDGLLYVALSHVWADGLGNPKSMQLPCCQIVRLGRLVETIARRLSAQQKQDGMDRSTGGMKKLHLYGWRPSFQKH